MELLLKNLTAAQAFEVMSDAQGGNISYEIQEIDLETKESIIYSFTIKGATEVFEDDYEYPAAQMGRYYFITDIDDKCFYGIPREN